MNWRAQVARWIRAPFAAVWSWPGVTRLEDHRIPEADDVSILALREGAARAVYPDGVLTPGQALRVWRRLEFVEALARGRQEDLRTMDAAMRRMEEEHEQMARKRDELWAALERIEAACLAVCRDNTAEAVGEPDPDVGRFLLVSENGDPIIDTDDPAVVIARMAECWGKTSDRCERAEYAVATLQRVACEAYAAWDSDQDSRVGKLLAALGGTRGIRRDVDAAVEAIGRPAAPTPPTGVGHDG